MADLACLFIYSPNDEFSTFHPKSDIYFPLHKDLFSKKTFNNSFFWRIHYCPISDPEYHFIRIYVFPGLPAGFLFI